MSALEPPRPDPASDPTHRDPALILASGSPRRRELLGALGLAFVVRAADVDETAGAGEPPDDLVRRLAVAKALAVVEAATAPDVVVLAADTVVALDDEILGKPADAAEAIAMLGRLSGRTHRVLTGVAVARRAAGPQPGPVSGTDLDPDADPDAAAVAGPATSVAVDAEVTTVSFLALSADDIARYVASGEPLDKAGAYGIQGAAGAFVAGIDGNRDNVVGLPMGTTRRLLAEAGVDVPAAPGP